MSAKSANLSTPEGRASAGPGGSITSFPTVSPLGADSLHPSPVTGEVAVGRNTDVIVSDLTATLDADKHHMHRNDAASSSSAGDECDDAGGDWRSPFTPTADLPAGDAQAPRYRCVVLSGLAENVRARDVHQQCSQFGPVERVYMPRKTAHPVHGVSAFVTMATDALARAVADAFECAGFDAQLTNPPIVRHGKHRGRGRRASMASGGSYQTNESAQSRHPISVEDYYSHRTAPPRQAQGADSQQQQLATFTPQ